MKKKLALALALLLNVTLVGCGDNTTGQPQTSTPLGGADSGGLSSAVSSCSSDAAASEQEISDYDMTAAYCEELAGVYTDEYDAQYTIRQDGTLTRENANGEQEEGNWRVWRKEEKEYFYLAIQNTAHPASYTFETTEAGGISLFDDTTGELSNLFTPVEATHLAP